MATNVGVLPVAGFQIDYADELEKITDFLSRYVPPPRAQRALPADDDEAAEEDDLADDINDLGVDDGDATEERSKAKYMKVLRRVANRQTAEVIIDLADLRKVSPCSWMCRAHPTDNSSRRTRRCCKTFSEIHADTFSCSAMPSTSSCLNPTPRWTTPRTCWISSCSKEGR